MEYTNFLLFFLIIIYPPHFLLIIRELYIVKNDGKNRYFRFLGDGLKFNDWGLKKITTGETADWGDCESSCEE